MQYIKCFNEDGSVNPDMVVREDGLELRRSSTEEWADYEASGVTPQDTFTQSQWDALNDNSSRRLRYAKPS